MPLPNEVIDDVFRSIPTHDPGVYVDRGVAGALIINVYGCASKRVLSCHVDGDAADEQLLRDIEDFAARRVGAARLKLA